MLIKKYENILLFLLFICNKILFLNMIDKVINHAHLLHSAFFQSFVALFYLTNIKE